VTDWPAQAVLARLEWGRDRAHPIGSLQEVLGWPRRAVEAAVQALRLDGFAVCSGPDGIWLGTAEDLVLTLHSLKGRIIAQHATYRALRKTLRRLQGVQQLGMFDAA